jgi:hypothetical protein
MSEIREILEEEIISTNKWIKENDAFPHLDEILKCKFDNINVIFGLRYSNELNETNIQYEMLTPEYNNIFHGDYTLKDNVSVAKGIVNNVINHYHFPDDERYIDGYLAQQIEHHNEDIEIENEKQYDRQIETAQKTGYVQGVCESVLAFNNDENRKIMTEATMTFLSKKLLSEMNVTKDMAQKFANPETYKALEQCVFAPQQEQQRKLLWN